MTRLSAVLLATAFVACGPTSEDATDRAADSRAGVTNPDSSRTLPRKLKRIEWRLTHFDRSDSVPDSIVITLEFDDDMVTGSAGCNSYFAQWTTGMRPRSISIDAAGTTRMACSEEIMSAEGRFLEALARVQRYELREGRLTLSYRQGAENRTLVLAPADAGS